MNPIIPLVPRAVRLLALCLLAFPPAVGTAAASSPPATSDAGGPGGGPPKPYTLYVGTDFAIEWEGQLRPVQDVRENEFVVSVNGSPMVVKPRNADLKIRADDVLKVTSSTATISNFKAERAYTPENDPQVKFESMASMAASASAATDLARGTMAQKQSMAGFSAAYAATMGSPETQAALDAAAASTATSAADAASAFQSSASSESSDLNAARNFSIKMQSELAAERFDAFSLTFEVSAPRPLTKPYIVVVTRYRERPEQPDTERIWTYAQALRRVDMKPASVRMVRGGFPAGYKLEDVQVHLYDQGVEIATNVARKRVAITADEAFQFSIVNYIENHRGATLQPMPLKMTLPADLRQRLPAEKLSRNFYVRVSKNGMPTGAFSDEACVEKITDPDLEAAALALRFNPALNVGKPVEGVAPVRLDQLTL